MASKGLLDKLTEDDWQRIEAIREGSIQSQTDRIKLEDARAAVKTIWKMMDMDEPDVFLAPSPFSAVAWGAILSSEDTSLSELDRSTERLEDRMFRIDAPLDISLREAEGIQDLSPYPETDNHVQRSLQDFIDQLKERFSPSGLTIIDRARDIITDPSRILRVQRPADVLARIDKDLHDEIFTPHGQIVAFPPADIRFMLYNTSDGIDERLRTQIANMQWSLKIPYSRVEDRLSGSSPLQVAFPRANNLHEAIRDTIPGDRVIPDVVEKLKIKLSLDSRVPGISHLIDIFAIGSHRLRGGIQNIQGAELDFTTIDNTVSSLRRDLFLQLPLDTRWSMNPTNVHDRTLYQILSQAMAAQDFYDRMDAQPQYFSVWWRAWATWYEAATVAGVKFDPTNYNAFQAWTKSCPFVVPYRELCIVSDNPVSIKWDGEQRLHNPEGPAVLYRDGWSVWAIDGTRVDEQIVMRPESQTIEQIAQEENEEVRRIRIDRFGWMRYLEESESEVVETRRNDIEATVEILADTPLGQRLITFCPSTGRRYSLALPGDRVSTCEEAQKRLWGDRDARIIGRT